MLLSKVNSYEHSNMNDSYQGVATGLGFVRNVFTHKPMHSYRQTHTSVALEGHCAIGAQESSCS